MKKKGIALCFIGVALAPLLLVLCLHVGIAVGSYLSLDINLPEQRAVDWFIFAGSYLGGAMTLMGVLATLRHERRLYRHEVALDAIWEEQRNIADVLSGLDLYDPFICYTGLKATAVACDRGQSPDFSEIRCRIGEGVRRVSRSAIDLQLRTDIAVPLNCSNCDRHCRLNEVKGEYLSLHQRISAAIMEALLELEQLAAEISGNAIQDQLIIEYRNHIRTCRESGILPEYSDADIEEAKGRKADVAHRMSRIEGKLEELSGIRSNEYQRLVQLSKEYSSIRMRNAARQLDSAK